MQQETRVMFLWSEQLIAAYGRLEQLQRSMKSTHTMRITQTVETHTENKPF